MQRLFVLLTAGLLFPLIKPAAGIPVKPDVILLNARIITMNAKQPLAESVAIKGERILWAGRTGEAKRLFPDVAETLDLNGATILPGFIDAHTHLMTLGESFLRLNIKDVPTEQEIAERVKQRASTAAAGEWIRVGGGTKASGPRIIQRITR